MRKRLGQQDFLKYQAIFYQYVDAGDLIIELGKNSSTAPGDDFLENFQGSNLRNPTDWYRFPTLYNTQIDADLRDKIGISSIQSGTIYLSPLQLIPVFGTFEIDKLITVIKKSGHNFSIDRIEYLEPLYDSCVAIEINLKDAINT